jgi:hypothetical protein
MAATLSMSDLKWLADHAMANDRRNSRRVDCLQNIEIKVLRNFN